VSLKSGTFTEEECEKLYKATDNLAKIVSEVCESFAERTGLSYAATRALHAELMLLVISILGDTHVEAASEADRIVAMRLAE